MNKKSVQIMEKVTRREALKKGSRLIAGAAVSAGVYGLFSGCSDQKVTGVALNGRKVNVKDIRLTVVYDNVLYWKGLISDWGFSCLIEGLDRTILFDSGMNGDILMSNMSQLGIDVNGIDELILSHDHPDHIGGVEKCIEVNPGLRISLVRSFRSGFKKAAVRKGAKIKEIDGPEMISENCFSTGEMKSMQRNEHSLVIITDMGLIVLTGCAHPGLVDIVEQVQRISQEKILLLMGGFHRMYDMAPNIRKIARRLKKAGVKFVAPSHCSGSEAIEIFSQTFGQHSIESGLGRIITAHDFFV